MKKFISVVAVVILCLSMVCPAFAAADDFVPSAGNKPTPETTEHKIVGPDGKDKADVKDECLDLTPLADGDEKLKKLYEDLLAGGTEDLFEKLGVDPDKAVIRDLFDLDLLCDDLKDMLDNGDDLKVVFDLDLGPNDKLYVGSYIDNEWVPAKSVVNNGDGTVTVIFDHVGPVAFVVEGKAGTAPIIPTGDTANVVLWVGIMVIAAVALVILVVSRRKVMR